MRSECPCPKKPDLPKKPIISKKDRVPDCKLMVAQNNRAHCTHYLKWPFIMWMIQSWEIDLNVSPYRWGCSVRIHEIPSNWIFFTNTFQQKQTNKALYFKIKNLLKDLKWIFRIFKWHHCAFSWGRGVEVLKKPCGTNHH